MDQARLQSLWVTKSLLNCTSAMGSCNAEISLLGLVLLEDYLVRSNAAA